MVSMKLLLCAAVLAVTCIEISQAAGCPSPSKIYDYTKKESCRSDGECKSGKICCLNPARVKSCTYPDTQGGGGNKPQPGPVYCEGARCQPYEVCKPDPANNRRKKCQRA